MMEFLAEDRRVAAMRVVIAIVTTVPRLIARRIPASKGRDQRIPIGMIESKRMVNRKVGKSPKFWDRTWYAQGILPVAHEQD
jgi:hypothetical protein